MAKPFTSLILLAGGQGTRMQSVVPKQFMEVKGRKMVSYSFQLFESLPSIDEIIVVVEPSYRHFFTADIKRVSFASPGFLRQDSVWQGLQCVSQQSEWICIHDSARPFIQASRVEAVLQAAHTHGAAALGVRVKNTIKEVGTDGYVVQTFPREKLWEIHTPQVIRKDLLILGFQYAFSHHKIVTDDVSLVELIGHRVVLVEDDYGNIKITTPEDLRIAEI